MGMALCAGVGGLELAMRLVYGDRYRTAVIVEREVFAVSTLVARMENHAIHQSLVWDDLSTFEGRPWRDRISLITCGFPCFRAGTMVLTQRGYVPIETVFVGDKVLTHRGRWRAVDAISTQSDIALREVAAQGVPNIITTDEHPFWTRRKLPHVDGYSVRRSAEAEWSAAQAIRNHPTPQIRGYRGRTCSQQPLQRTVVDRVLFACGFQVSEPPSDDAESVPYRASDQLRKSLAG